MACEVMQNEQQASKTEVDQRGRNLYESSAIDLRVALEGFKLLSVFTRRLGGTRRALSTCIKRNGAGISDQSLSFISHSPLFRCSLSSYFVNLHHSRCRADRVSRPMRRSHSGEVMESLRCRRM